MVHPYMMLGHDLPTLGGHTDSTMCTHSLHSPQRREEPRRAPAAPAIRSAPLSRRERTSSDAARGVGEDRAHRHVLGRRESRERAVSEGRGP
jgi:hypothetical protein